MGTLKRTLVGLIPLATLTIGMGSLAQASRPLQQATPTPTAASACLPDLRKWIDPSQLLLGDAAAVTLVVSQTCPGLRQPIDIILLADESNSMTMAKGQVGIRTPTSRPLPTRGTPEPGQTQPPEPPEPPPGEPTNAPPGDATPGGQTGGGEPPFCNPRRRQGGDATEPLPILPTPIRETRTPPPRPLQESPVPPAEPTLPRQNEPPVQPPGPIISPEPTEDINELEPPGSVDQIREIKTWIRDFLDQESVKADLASGALRIGFVSFSDRARIRQPVTDQPTKIIAAANRMRGGNITRPEPGLREAERQLTEARKKAGADRAQAIFLLSDFQFCNRDVRPGARRSGVQIVAVGFGVRPYDRNKLQQIASKSQWVLSGRDVNRAARVYESELIQKRQVAVAELVVRDQLTDTMKLVVGSTYPPTLTITGQMLEWRFAPPSLPITLGYSVQPQLAGVWPVSVRAQALWTDSEKLAGAADFPRVSVEVLLPTPTATSTPTLTPTATATDTPTVTPTPTPAALHLPILFRDWPPAPTPTPAPTKCVPELQTVDVAAVVDTSTSMLETTPGGTLVKLRAAIEAAQELVNLLKSEDQVAVVGFNSRAQTLTGLTSDRQRITSALTGLAGTTAVGTRIDLGLQAALDELISPRHKSTHNRSIVLVTDGRHVGPPGTEAVIEVADRIRAEGIKLVTVGLGADIDEPLLRSIATTPELYFAAPNAEGLLEIYRRIAIVIPCP